MEPCCSVLMLDSNYDHFLSERPVFPDLLRLAALQLLQVEGQRQQQVAQVLAGEGEGVVGCGLYRGG
ncbi:hypothetical protein NQZ68_033885 [Dissostichus eleginoides]|nr:hypothetical protein NQZ68_033885 [Dissostichus eleginoides]